MRKFYKIYDADDYDENNPLAVIASFGEAPQIDDLKDAVQETLGKRVKVPDKIKFVEADMKDALDYAVKRLHAEGRKIKICPVCHAKAKESDSKDTPVDTVMEIVRQYEHGVSINLCQHHAQEAKDDAIVHIITMRGEPDESQNAADFLDHIVHACTIDDILLTLVMGTEMRDKSVFYTSPEGHDFFHLGVDIYIKEVYDKLKDGEEFDFTQVAWLFANAATQVTEAKEKQNDLISKAEVPATATLN